MVGSGHTEVVDHWRASKMTSTRLIKRYANRKLYDTSESRYVKLEEIADMVDRGEEVKIIDNETKEDITRISLAQIFTVRRGRKGSRRFNDVSEGSCGQYG